ncbi:MAG: NTP transferase domain-containing protein [Duncaniella sp.]|nr:NTP transferase domain-containing protein [Duncaniella sp.]
MKGLIFAAGLGTRLYPLTADSPKALVKLAGKPMLQHVIEKLGSAGITDIVINIHHYAGKIIEFLERNDNFGLNIQLSVEKEYPLETGGGLLKAAEWLDGDEPVLLHNADIYTDFPIGEMASAHMKSGADITLLADNRKSSRQLLFDRDKRMRGWTNLATGEVKPALVNLAGLEPKAFGGVHIINPSVVFPLLKAGAIEEVFSITQFYISVCNDVLIKGFTPSQPYGWHDIGTVEKLAAAESYLLSK